MYGTRIIPDTSTRGGFLVLHRGAVHWSGRWFLAVALAEYLETSDRRERVG